MIRTCRNNHTRLVGNDRRCKTCRSEQYYRSVQRDPYMAKRKHLRNAFGLSLDAYNNMYSAQNGLCLGCYRHQSTLKRGLVVDHCHRTGKVRGLLCGNCNLGIGNLQDNPSVLRRLADYLETR